MTNDDLHDRFLLYVTKYGNKAIFDRDEQTVQIEVEEPEGFSPRSDYDPQCSNSSLFLTLTKDDLIDMAKYFW